MSEFITYKKIWALGKPDIADIFSDPDDEIVVQAKYDGANFRIKIEDGNITFGSRRLELKEDGDHRYQKMFNGCIQYIKDKLKDKTLPNNVILNGENMVKHTLSYNWDKIPPFLGFDVYDLTTERYLPYIKTKEIFDSLDIEMVPLIKICKAFDIQNPSDKDVPISKYAPLTNLQQQEEGMVYKNERKQMYGKFVRSKFKEDNRKAFGGSPKFATNDDDKLVLSYATNERIEKIILKLMDEGIPLELKMMNILPIRVWEDIWEENWKEIISKKWILNLHNCKKFSTQRCFSILNNMVTNKQFEVKNE